MSMSDENAEPLVVTAILTTGAVRVTHGMAESEALVEEILTLNHEDLETTMWVGDIEYHTTQDGPYPNRQMRISVLPSSRYAALSYTDHDDPNLSVVNSHNPMEDSPEVYLIFNGDTGDVFPRSAVIPITDARNALLELLQTRSLPTCIEWRPFDRH
jgi:immunity protein Imm1 of predicted polymorphic toxin system